MKFTSLLVVCAILTIGTLPQSTPATQTAEPTYSTFAQWCLNRNSLTKDAQTTVQALLTVAETTDCDRAAQILANSEYLMLDGYQIREELFSLNLSGNLISDLQPLKSLNNLTQLNLMDNPLHNPICPVRDEVCRF